MQGMVEGYAPRQSIWLFRFCTILLGAHQVATQGRRTGREYPGGTRRLCGGSGRRRNGAAPIAKGHVVLFGGVQGKKRTQQKAKTFNLFQKSEASGGKFHLVEGKQWFYYLDNYGRMHENCGNCVIVSEKGTTGIRKVPVEEGYAPHS